MTVRKLLILTIFTLVFSSCSIEEYASYEQFQNNIPPDGIRINYDPDSSLTNIEEINSELKGDDKDVFTKSLAWFGTESEYGFEMIHGKTARELVNIVNCLKKTSPKEKSKCITKSSKSTPKNGAL
jgi:hypothetical protein